MTFKYLACACTLALIVTACTAPTTAPSPSASTVASSPAALASPSPTPIVAGIKALLGLSHHWYTVPDGLVTEEPVVTATFESDPAATLPRARLRTTGREIPFVQASGINWNARVPLAGLPVGEHTVDLIERVSGAGDTVYGTVVFRLSQPEYVVWTLDFEGDEATDAAMANTAAIADGLTVPTTVMWNPRAWTTTAVAPQRAEAMLAWTKGRAAKGDEVALHLHMYLDYVRAAGIAPKSRPAWSGRLDGFDVPMTAYTEEEQRTLIAYGLRLMSEHGLSGVTSFRAGGLMADAATLRAAVAAGMTADCSATGAGTFGSLRLPWTLAADAQPYRPSKEDANKAGDLSILEAPTNGGNTYGYTVASIAPVVRADLAMLAKPGEPAAARKGIVIVSHPATIDATERAAIETLLRAFEPLRYDKDAGPLRFVTLRQLSTAWR